MNYLVAVLNALTSILCFALAYVHYKSARRIGCFVFSIASYGFYYGVIPTIFLLFVYANGRYTTVGYTYVDILVNKKPDLLFNSSALCLSGAILLSVFYSIFYRRKSPDIVDSELTYNRMNTIGVITFIISFLPFFIIVKSLGGILGVFKYTEIIRAYGFSNTAIDPRIVLLRPIAAIILLPPFLFFSVYYKRKSRQSLILFIVSFIVASYYLIFNSGKAVMILFYICFIISYFLAKYKKVPVHRLIFVMLIALMSLRFLDYVFYTLSYSSQPTLERNGFLALLNEFMFPYSNVASSKEMNDIYGYSYFGDYYNWILNIVPSSILNMFGLEEPIPAYYYTTRYYSINTRLLGGTPIDFLTFGARQFGLMGLIINTVLMSFITAKVDMLLERLDYREFFVIILRISLWFTLLIPYADPISNIRNRTDIILLIFVVIFILASNKSRRAES